MNSSGSKLSYLYPITRIRSIERLLRTTVHSAFLVVTPIDPNVLPTFPKNIKPQHTPQLYSRPSVRGASEAADYSVRKRRPMSKDYGADGLDIEDERRDLTESYTVPQHQLWFEGQREKKTTTSPIILLTRPFSIVIFSLHPPYLPPSA